MTLVCILKSHKYICSFSVLIEVEGMNFIRCVSEIGNLQIKVIDCHEQLG